MERGSNMPHEHYRQAVTALAPEIQRAFNRLDTGATTLQGFRADLAAIGVAETPSFSLLLRTNRFTFAQLLKALCRNDRDMSAKAAGEINNRAHPSPLAPLGAGSGTQPPRPGRARVDRSSPNQDVIAWSSPSGLERQAQRAKSPGAWGDGVGGADHTGSLLRRSSFNPSEAYKTQSQRDAVEGLGHPEASPVTSAGYRSDPALDRLRESIYEQIRLLDAGAVTTTDFERALLNLGVEIPASVTRLLGMHRAHGAANFHSFVRAFEPYFEARTGGAPVPPSYETHVAAPSTNIYSGAVPYANDYTATSATDNNAALPSAPVVTSSAAPHSHPAMQTHGDVISWSGTPSALEQIEDQHSVRGRRHLDSERTQSLLRQGAVDLLCWDKNGGNDNGGTAGVHNGSVPASAPRATHTSGDIIAWADDSRSKSNEMAGRGLHMVSNVRGTFGGSVPFGTDADLAESQRHARPVVSGHVAPAVGLPGRPARGRTHFNEVQTGQWFQPEARQSVPVTINSVPFGTDADVPQRFG